MAEIDDEEVPSYPVPPARMQQFDANSRAAGAGGVTGGGPLSQVQAPASAASTNPYSLKDAYAKLYSDLQAQAQQKSQSQQDYLASLKQQEGALTQAGMSDYDKAAMLFQAAGALGQTTRSGGFGETLGNLGTAMAGPLSKAAEAQRQRQQQLQQLQLARQKLAMEMAGTGTPSVSETLQLMKAQQDAEANKGGETFKLETVDDKPVLVGSRGTIKPFDRAAAGVGEVKEDEVGGIPADVKAKGPKAVEEYVKVYGKKAGEAVAGAETAAENISSTLPILKRAEEAYTALAKNKDIGPYLGSDFNRRIAAFANTDAEANRQAYEQAAKELELAKAQISMKGQGAITEGERKILQLTLPRLDASRAETGMQTLKLMRQQMEAAIAKPGRMTGAQPDKKESKVVDFGDLK